MEFIHKPVMLNECIDGLDIKPDGIYIDGTAGGGGHSSVIASKLTTGKLIALDKDPDAISVLKQRLPDASVVQTDFRNMKSVLDEMNIQAVDGVLLDLGVSSHQLDVATRGFSYNLDAPLDMRMAQTGVSAHTIVNTYSKEDLTDILFKYGEESYARSIANAIVKARE
ncbi:MAG: 16S rRNA (cytosine(1402)-N(4))-methyltransferase RsmH, partial [Oscillospiraceae bacterium]